MDISTEKNKANTNRASPFSAILQTIPVAFRRLVRFFTLTDEDRLKAGVNVRGEGRDD
jgi:hypothetical protein